MYSVLRKESGPVMRLNFLHRPRPVGREAFWPTGIFSGFLTLGLFSGTEARLLSLYCGFVTPLHIKSIFFSVKLPLWALFSHFPIFFFFFLFFSVPIPPLCAFHIHSTHCRPRHSYYRSDCLFPISFSLLPSTLSSQPQLLTSPRHPSLQRRERVNPSFKARFATPDTLRLPDTDDLRISPRWRPDTILTNSRPRLEISIRPPPTHPSFASTRDPLHSLPKHSIAASGAQKLRLIHLSAALCRVQTRISKARLRDRRSFVNPQLQFLRAVRPLSGKTATPETPLSRYLSHLQPSEI